MHHYIRLSTIAALCRPWDQPEGANSVQIMRDKIDELADGFKVPAGTVPAIKREWEKVRNTDPKKREKAYLEAVRYVEAHQPRAMGARVEEMKAIMLSEMKTRETIISLGTGIFEDRSCLTISDSRRGTIACEPKTTEEARRLQSWLERWINRTERLAGIKEGILSWLVPRRPETAWNEMEFFERYQDADLFCVDARAFVSDLSRLVTRGILAVTEDARYYIGPNLTPEKSPDDEDEPAESPETTTEIDIDI